ncbi:PspC domain-containing protein [Carboxylicivirga mesophila]|uniref:PspC domain-containing protein n=1 Tax=Carboxylicivirga mesophila TaxID=1166478 RepID=A0ABS5K4H0_9BACT|nr:PspC domain-containing protein [Carboxylicivirga mesophila]MBS2209920.1 PspC domain-containing protein [Carboxylicivirga mesophila]
MNKTVTINISGHMFYIDEDAYTRLRSYLDKIETTFRSQESGDEIISDIESRVAEIFNERINRETGVVTLEMVDEVIATMGEPEQFEDGEGEEQKSYTPPTTMVFRKASRRFYRDIDNRVLGGVCAGIAAYFGIDVVLVRVLFVILTVLTWGGIPLIYIILWIALPPARTTAQKLQMRGERITIENIERSIRDEYDEVKKKFGHFKESKTYKKGESFFSRFSKSEKATIFIILAVVGAALLFNMPDWHGVFYGPATVFTGFSHHVVPTFNHIFFPGALTFVLVLLVIGLIFKTFLKIVLYLIAFLLLGSLALKVLFWLFGGFMLMC